MSFLLEHIDACLPITAIEVLDLPDARLILIGRGPYTLVVDEASGSLLDHLQIFQRNTIHGINVVTSFVEPGRHHAKLLLWGGCSLRVAKLNLRKAQPYPKASLENLSSEYAAPDWILDASFNQKSSDKQNPLDVRRACLITAHNVLLGLELIDDLSKKLTTIQLHELAAGLKSVLYSADVVWLSSTQILIAAGTVFGEIIVWSCYLVPGSTTPVANASSVQHFFGGHEGSIFAVDISPEIPCPNQNHPRRLLASCSDDRTIRIWDISDCSLHNLRNDDNKLSTMLEAHTTGFGDTVMGELGVAPAECIASAWGHISRIWGIHFLSASLSPRAISVKLISRGEDATCQLWNLSLHINTHSEIEFSPTDTDCLKSIASYGYHTGRNIWSMATCTNVETSNFYTGGADGSLISFIVGRNDTTYCNYGVHKRLFVMNDIYHHDIHTTTRLNTPLIPSIRNAKYPDNLTNYSFVSENCFIAISSRGVVQLGWISDLKKMNSRSEELNTLHNPSLVSWEIVSTLDDLKSYSILSSQPKQGIAIIGGHSGTLWVYNHETRSTSILLQIEERPSEIFMVDPGSFQSDKLPSSLSDSFHFVTTSHNIPTANLFLVGKSTVFPDVLRRMRLELPDNFSVTSGLMIEGKRLLILGSRGGDIAIFRTGKSSGSEGVCLPTRVRCLHGRDAVTSIICIPQSDCDELVQGPILTTGRDGQYCVHTLSETDCPDQPENLQTIHRSSPPFGPNIEGAYFDKVTNDLILLGFRSKSFIVWNESKQIELMNVECGGSHRTWAYNKLYGTNEAGIFLWTKASTFNLLARTALPYRHLRVGGHGREIKTMAILGPTLNITGKEQKIIATGAEDTAIRFFALGESYRAEPWGSFKCLRTLKKHTAGVQHLQWSQSGKFLFSSAGREEFYIWRIRSIPGFGVGVVCETQCPKGNAVSDLRITSFDVLETGEETEFGESSFLLCLAYSDSTIKLFYYTSTHSEGTFHLLAKGQYMTSCLTQVQFAIVGGGIFLTTGSTDGHVATWGLTKIVDSLFSTSAQKVTRTQIHHVPTTPLQMIWRSRHCIHQNSIKVMTTVILSETELLIITGGDDNAFSISRLRFSVSGSQATYLSSTTSLPQAHASAITALAVLYQRHNQDDAIMTNLQIAQSRLLIATSGNDQRLKFWSVQVGSPTGGANEIEVSLLRDMYTAVADISCIGSYTDKENCDDNSIDVGRMRNKIILCGVGMDMWLADTQLDYPKCT